MQIVKRYFVLLKSSQIISLSLKCNKYISTNAKTEDLLLYISISPLILVTLFNILNSTIQ